MFLFKPAYEDALSQPSSIVQGDKFRITILTDSLVRLEYSENGEFEDRPSQFAINRNFKTVKFDLYESEDSIEIITDKIILKYDKKPFSSEGLSIKLRGNYSIYHSTYNYGEPIDSLGGTARTLDNVDGSVKLEDGIISKYGYSVIDDSHSAIMLEDGWYTERANNNIDLYYFGYGHDYNRALKDYFILSGKPPLLPKFVLGNWWSRYYKYTEETYLSLFNRFEQEEIPFNVAVIDMDWHLVDIPEVYGSGWTGYTWNTDFFPDPERFLTELHDRGYKVTLNVHPHDGVRPFEEPYAAMCEDLGVNPNNETNLDFDVYDRSFMDAYFRHLHHPNEKIGVDFWWVDWQQGGKSRENAIDPLWALNHLHYHDISRDGGLGLTFSRYAGPGSHRYPIGFSGDTHVTWDSLAFQPYFTSTATNIGYGWWSHDIGGHMFGYRDNELFVRWIQFGVFSPIMRLHSSSSDFLVKEPWEYPEPYQSVIKRNLQLRHQLIPYLHTYNIKTHIEGDTLIKPVYYYYSDNDEAYEVPNQYFFGEEIMVAPITTKINSESNYGKVEVWLPEGNWIDLFTGDLYEGNRNIEVFRDLTKIPVFSKLGNVIPLASQSTIMNNNQDSYDLLIFHGDDGVFELYDNIADSEQDVHMIKFELTNESLIIHPVEFNESLEMQKEIRLIFYNVNLSYLDFSGVNIEGIYDSTNKTSTFSIGKVNLTKKNVFNFQKHEKPTENYQSKIFDFLKQAECKYSFKEKILKIISDEQSLNKKVSNLLCLNDVPKSILGPVLEQLTRRDYID